MTENNNISNNEKKLFDTFNQCLKQYVDKIYEFRFFNIIESYINNNYFQEKINSLMSNKNPGINDKYLVDLKKLKIIANKSWNSENVEIQINELEELNQNSFMFFKGTHNSCKKDIKHFNRCSEEDISREKVNCNSEEKDFILYRREKGLCHHFDTKKGKGINFYKSWEHDYCFKNLLAKIIQVNAREQLGIKWDDSCRALTFEEAYNVDFSKIDFTELFNNNNYLNLEELDIINNGNYEEFNSLKENLNNKVDIFADVSFIYNNDALEQ